MWAPACYQRVAALKGCQLRQAKGVATPGGGRSSLAAALQGAMAKEPETEDWRAEGRAAAGNAQVERSAPPSRFERMKVWAC